MMWTSRTLVGTLKISLDRLTFFAFTKKEFSQYSVVVLCCNFCMYSSMYIVKEPDCKVHILNYTLLSFYTRLLELKLSTICGIYRLWESCLLGRDQLLPFFQLQQPFQVTKLYKATSDCRDTLNIPKPIKILAVWRFQFFC